MTKKDKLIAKQLVLKNMRKDPLFYDRLQHLNISDKDMIVESQKSKMLKAIKQTENDFRQLNRFKINI